MVSTEKLRVYGNGHWRDLCGSLSENPMDAGWVRSEDHGTSGQLALSNIYRKRLRPHCWRNLASLGEAQCQVTLPSAMKQSVSLRIATNLTVRTASMRSHLSPSSALKTGGRIFLEDNMLLFATSSETEEGIN
jgi:hypothetical protein